MFIVGMHGILIAFIIAGFLEKNRDTFSADLLQLIHNTSNKFLQHLFVEDIGKNIIHSRLISCQYFPTSALSNTHQIKSFAT